MFVFFTLFSFFYAQACQNNIKTVIVHMPGTVDGGLNFLNDEMSTPKKLDFCRRYNNSLNPEKTFYKCDHIGKLNETLIYTNNIPLNQMDLGGLLCVSFYKDMILKAYFLYPKADIILVGASQGSVGPFGALAQLIEENHSVIPNIKKILVEAALGSTHETINDHAQKIPILKFLPRISRKIAPLIVEYFPRFAPGFARYDAFQPQLYHYIEQINKSDKADHIQFLILHDKNDEIIPCSCAQKAEQLLQKDCKYIQTAVDAARYLNPDEMKKYKIPFLHLPSNASETWGKIISFLNNKRQPKPIQQIIDQKNDLTIDTWFVSKSPLQRFAIRRTRDLIVLITFFASYRIIKCIVQSISTLLKYNR